MSEEKPKRAPRKKKVEPEAVVTPENAGSEINAAFRGLLVVHLVDSLTYGPPGAGTDVVVHVEGTVKAPLRKPNGMVVFTDTPAGVRRVTIRTGRYHPVTFDVTPEALDPTYPVVLVPLVPLPSYPFPDGVTLLRASVRDPDGRPLAGVPVRAVVITEACAKARLAQDSSEGAQELALARVAGRLMPGERLWLPGESCVVYEVGSTNRAIHITAPLQNSFPRQTQLLPCVETQSDERGEVVIPFGNCRSAAFDVQVQLLSDDMLSKEVRMEEGKMTNLGVIAIT
ncbi:hypothetical protein [Tumebacillus permanentifrigoris]|uniref:Uncharacterized protein n=1 Tax=Tumebacillus permanentifrigoris TaxID=378543 RepID=A0A316D723_9BACL|nr:hypothetical protein [Tumebacillus permanentifrigoris]PWK11520.1 hypothetical protein C7459_11049 [Tumebacillus permanentifrigoris]